MVVVTTGAGPQGVISGPQLVDPWPGGPWPNLVIVLSPLLGSAPHPSLFLDPGPGLMIIWTGPNIYTPIVVLTAALGKKIFV